MKKEKRAKIVKAVPEKPSTVTTPPDSGLSERMSQVEKKVDGLNVNIVDLSTNVRVVTDKVGGLTDQIDNVKKDTEQIYKDRDEITAIKERTTVIDGKVEMSIAKQTSIETGLKADLRALQSSTDENFNATDKRLKALEDRPTSNTGFSIIKKLGRFALVRLK